MKEEHIERTMLGLTKQQISKIIGGNIIRVGNIDVGMLPECAFLYKRKRGGKSPAMIVYKHIIPNGWVGRLTMVVVA